MPAKGETGAKTLPPITVAKLEETGLLLERIVQENVDAFVAAGQRFKEAHRDGSSRPLQPGEAMQLAVAMTDDEDTRIGLAEQVQVSELRAYDEPSPIEVLAASLGPMVPALSQGARQLIALVEMPADVFQEADEAGTLQDVVDERAKPLRALVSVEELRERLLLVGEHYAAALGVTLGEATRLLTQTVWQALTTAMATLSSGSRPSQLTGSAEPTAD